MVYDLIEIIYSALSASFYMADQIFSAVGIALVSAICMMVLVSTVLRLFTSRFVGQQINLAHERMERQAENTEEAQFQRFHKNRMQNYFFNKRSQFIQKHGYDPEV